jgi:hypothetical protein
VKTIILASAFLFWAANQAWPMLHQATLFNDLAIALFVVDVLLSMKGRPIQLPEGLRYTEAFTKLAEAPDE